MGNLLIKNIIDMSVDTVNTIVDITTLAEVQNELTMLAAIPAITCTADAMTNCKDTNTPPATACTKPTLVTPPTDATAKTAMEAAVTAAWAKLTPMTYCIPDAGSDVTIPGAGAVAEPTTYYTDFTVTCAKGAMFLKAVSSVVAATMVLHLA